MNLVLVVLGILVYNLFLNLIVNIKFVVGCFKVVIVFWMCCINICDLDVLV